MKTTVTIEFDENEQPQLSAAFAGIFAGTLGSATPAAKTSPASTSAKRSVGRPKKTVDDIAKKAEADDAPDKATLRTRIRECAKEFGKDAVLEVLDTYGASNLTGVPEEEYGNLLEDLIALGE